MSCYTNHPKRKHQNALEEQDLQRVACAGVCDNKCDCLSPGRQITAQIQ
jgi:hypothetical protein